MLSGWQQLLLLKVSRYGCCQIADLSFPTLFFLQFLMVVNFIAIVIKYRYFQRRRWALIVVHFAFIVILLGALITHLFGKDERFIFVKEKLSTK